MCNLVGTYFLYEICKLFFLCALYLRAKYCKTMTSSHQQYECEPQAQDYNAQAWERLILYFCYYFSGWPGPMQWDYLMLVLVATSLLMFHMFYGLWALPGLQQFFCCLRSLAILQFCLKPLPRLRRRHSNGLLQDPKGGPLRQTSKR